MSNSKHGQRDAFCQSMADRLLARWSNHASLLSLSIQINSLSLSLSLSLSTLSLTSSVLGGKYSNEKKVSFASMAAWILSEILMVAKRSGRVFFLSVFFFENGQKSEGRVRVFLSTSSSSSSLSLCCVLPLLFSVRRPSLPYHDTVRPESSDHTTRIKK